MTVMPMASPSAGSLLRARAMFAPPLPATFSGMTFQPLRASSSSAISRAWVSTPPPARNPISILIGPGGLHCAACTSVALDAKTIARMAYSRILPSIGGSPLKWAPLLRTFAGNGTKRLRPAVRRDWEQPFRRGATARSKGSCGLAWSPVEVPVEADPGSIVERESFVLARTE